MRDTELYRQILGVVSPWSVASVEVDLAVKEIKVRVEHNGKGLKCPECGRRCRGYDSNERSWRHLDTCQLATILLAKVPRVECGKHGVRQVEVPWGEPGSRFTALFEALVIDWLQGATISLVADQLGLSWDQVAGIQDRAVERGLACRKLEASAAIGVDETSSRRGQRYVTIVSDLERPRVLWVAEGRETTALQSFYEAIGPIECEKIACVAMDMWEPFIKATRLELPDADQRIVFDKFHIASHLGEAVDKVRRQENRSLLAEGKQTLVGTKYLWLSAPAKLSFERRRELRNLQRKRLRTGRAWAIRDEAMSLWGYQSRTWAERAWKTWNAWAMRSRLEPIKKVARMINRHWEGVMNAVTSGITNAMAEGINTKIQWIKRQARGFRNATRFRNAIYFHLGALDLYPNSMKFTHSNA